MRIGLSTYAYSWNIGIYPNIPPHPFSVFDFLHSASLLGVHLVQIADNLPLHELSKGELERLKKVAKELEIDIEVGTRGLIDEHIEKYLHIAKFLSSPILRIVIDAKDFTPDKDEIIRILLKWEQRFRQENVILVIENHDRFPSLVLKEIIEAVDSPFVRICLDTVNSFGSLEGTKEVVTTLAPFSKNIHIKDFKIYRPYHNLGFVLEGTPAGEGMLDIPYILQQEAIRSDESITATIELWVLPESTIDETIAKEAAWREVSVNNMKRLFEL